MVLLIAYDLHQPGRGYEAIEKAIQQADDWIHPQGSVWIIDTHETPAEWRDRLQQAGDSNDEIFVVRLRRPWASRHMSKAEALWLKLPARTW